MIVLVTGGAGTVGTALAATAPPGVDVHVTLSPRRPAPGRRAHVVELTDPTAVEDLVVRLRPDVVVHTAYRQGERADVVDATACVASACAATGAAMVHLSTDAVFDGEDPPYDERDDPAPVNDYGRWKLAAEELVRATVADWCITRSSIVVRVDPPDRNCGAAVDAATGRTDTVFFSDEVRTPILVEDLAGWLWTLATAPAEVRHGVHHLPGPEAMSRLELARRLCRTGGVDPDGLRAGSSAGLVPPRPRDLTLRTVVDPPPPRPLGRIGGDADGSGG